MAITGPVGGPENFDLMLLAQRTGEQFRELGGILLGRVI